MKTESIHLGLILIGIALFIYAGWQIHTTGKFLKMGIKVAAVVSDLGAYQDSDGDWMFKPVFTYTDEEGDTICFQQDYASNIRSFDRGEKIEVVYDPQHIAQPRIFSYWGLFRTAIIVACLALPLLMVGIGYYVFEGYFCL
jgi:Protein of unknown function (DUF3592)